MTPKFNNLLTGLEQSGDSQALAVAECLRTIADNGDEQAKDSYLIGCAEEIRGWADYVIKQMKMRPVKKGGTR